jgi:hypothetical protein
LNSKKLCISFAPFGMNLQIEFRGFASHKRTFHASLATWAGSSAGCGGAALG